MKTDQYLTLCLEQAGKSPLHYRHGCIIVRGGKVIGQGYNDYRPGFNGGALKHGRIANSALDGPAMMELKEKLKKQKEKPEQQSQQRNNSKTFVPFEGTGGGHHANTPLSMHSEMMAIHSALSASSTLASTATSYEKPCFKLPRSDKRKARLRREVLAAYVKAVCETSQRSGKPQIERDRNSINNVAKEEQESRDDEQREDAVLSRSKESGRAFHERRSGEKHCHQKKKEKEKKNQKKVEYGDQYDRYGGQIQHAQHQSSAYKQSPSNVIRGYDVTSKRDMNESNVNSSAGTQHGRFKKDYKRSGKMKASQPPQPEPLLLPKGQAGGSTLTVSDRTKHSRLKGADLYVARLGWCRDPSTKPRRSKITMHQSDGDELAHGIDALSLSDPEHVLTPTPSSPSTNFNSCGSLHDELINREPSSRPSNPRISTDKPFDKGTVRASRPCYRCISYMHSVGIKRVFWTNDAGEWEGGKVRDLVDALDHSMENVKNGQGGPIGNGVFVTKHEVLMLRRLMGD